MAVIVKRWDDAGAPVLSGTAGALIAVLDDVLVTAAGWSKVFTGTNKAVYRAPAGGHQFYLRVDDTGTTSARIVGYESMTDVDTGTNPFPTAAQFSGGLYAPKSDAASTAARAWVIAVSDRLFHMWCCLSATTANSATSAIMWSFGDFKPGVTDAYASHLIAPTTATAPGNSMQFSANITSTSAGHYATRPYTALAGAVLLGKMGDTVASGTLGTFGYTYPNPADGGVYLAPIRLHEPNTVRGTLPGVWHVVHSQSNFTALDTFQGSGAHAGRGFLCLHQYNNSMVALETTNTWDV